jgi:hypothetical protein
MGLGGVAGRRSGWFSSCNRLCTVASWSGRRSGNESESRADGALGSITMVGRNKKQRHNLYRLSIRHQLHIELGRGMAAPGMETRLRRATTESGFDSTVGGAVATGVGSGACGGPSNRKQLAGVWK